MPNKSSVSLALFVGCVLLAMSGVSGKVPAKPIRVAIPKNGTHVFNFLIPSKESFDITVGGVNAPSAGSCTGEFKPGGFEPASSAVMSYPGDDNCSVLIRWNNEGLWLKSQMTMVEVQVQNGKSFTINSNGNLWAPSGDPETSEENLGFCRFNPAKEGEKYRLSLKVEVKNAKCEEFLEFPSDYELFRETVTTTPNAPPDSLALIWCLLIALGVIAIIALIALAGGVVYLKRKRISSGSSKA